MTELIHAIPAWFQLIFLALCIGILACRLWVLEAAASAGIPSQDKILVRMRFWFGIGIWVLIACSTADILIGAAEMSGIPSPEFSSLLPLVIFKTHFGRVWLMRIAALILLAVTTQVSAKYQDSRSILVFLFTLLLMISLSESASGHASDAGDFSIAEIADWLHLLAASLWGGGLFVLSMVVLPILVRQDDRMASAGVSRRFSRIAGIAVGIIAITSLYNAWSYVGSFEALWKTTYGLTALMKIILFLALIQFGAFNRYVSVPLLQEWAGVSTGNRGIINGLVVNLLDHFRSKQDKHPIASRFMRSVRIEAILMAGVLLCAALLRHEVPARHFSHIGHAQTTGNHGDHEHEAHMHYAAKPESVVVRLETNPVKINAGTPVSITVHLEDRNGKPLQGLTTVHERVLHAIVIGSDLNVFAHIHPEDLGKLTDKMLDKATFPLRYSFPKAGTYIVGLDFATKDGVYGKTATLFVSGQPNMGEPKIDLSRSKNFGRYRVAIDTIPKNVKAGEETTIKYFLRQDGKPVTDLQPYLGAAMHLAVVRSDLTQFMHTHGMIPDGSHGQHDDSLSMTPVQLGPDIEASIGFPVKGIYKIFGQVKHKGKVLLFDFMVEVQ